jgi:hypothetical protein
VAALTLAGPAALCTPTPLAGQAVGMLIALTLHGYVRPHRSKEHAGDAFLLICRMHAVHTDDAR